MKKSILSFVSIVVLVMSGCFVSDQSSNTKDADGAFQPDVTFDVNFEKIDGDQFIITGGSAKPGDIVFISNDFNPNEPGIAKRVESINGKIATLSDPELEEVFEDLTIQESYPLSEAQKVEDDRGSFNFLSLIKTEKLENGIKFILDDYSLVDKKGVKISVGGHVFLEKPKIDVDFNLLTQKVKLDVHLGESSELHLNADTGGKFILTDYQIILGNYVTPIKLWGFPVAQISYSLVLSVGVDGKMKVTASFEQTLAADISIDGTLKNLNPTYKFYAPNDDYYSYNVVGKGTFSGWASLHPFAALKVLQYDVAVVKGDFGGSANANLDLVVNEKVKKGTFDLFCEIHARAQAVLTGDKGQTYDLLDWSKEFKYTLNFLD